MKIIKVCNVSGDNNMLANVVSFMQIIFKVYIKNYKILEKSVKNTK